MNRNTTKKEKPTPWKWLIELMICELECAGRGLYMQRKNNELKNLLQCNELLQLSTNISLGIQVIKDHGMCPGFIIDT